MILRRGGRASGRKGERAFAYGSLGVWGCIWIAYLNLVVLSVESRLLPRLLDSHPSTLAPEVPPPQRRHRDQAGEA